jgi:hypothetical protein
MTDNITLPRAVVERARKALFDWAECHNDVADFCDDDKEVLAALDAALAEPDAKREPVHPGYIIGSHWLETAYSRIAAGEAEADVLAEVLGERGWAKREPATVEQVIAAHGPSWGPSATADFFTGFRAAERFHGIRKEDGK